MNILWYCLSLGLEWKLTSSSPVATAEFSKFAGILSAALAQLRYRCNLSEVKWSKSHSVMSNSLRAHRLNSPWNSPGQNTGLFLLQGVFPTQGLNPGFLYCRHILYQLSHKGIPRILEWVVYPFFRGSSWLRNQTGVSCIAGGFFTNWAMREAHTYVELIHFIVQQKLTQHCKTIILQ